MFLFLIMVHWTMSQPLNCTQSQTNWRLGTWSDLPLGTLLCGRDPMELIQINVARLSQPQNALWVAAAHHYSTGQLNLWSVQNLTLCNTSEVTKAMLLLGDSLEWYCNNLSQWTLEPVLFNALQQLFYFNQGLLEGCEACDTSNTTDSNELAFYYYQNPDIVTLRLLDSNTTLTYSLLKGQYNTMLALILFSLGAILAIVVLLLAVVVLKNKNRHYQILADQQQDEIRLDSSLDYHTEEYEPVMTTMSDLELQTSINNDDVETKKTI